MKSLSNAKTPQVADSEWIAFPGGELEAARPRVLCEPCRRKLGLAASTGQKSPQRPLCFACFRAGVERERALKAAGEIETASEARFQSQLPLAPLNRARLERLRIERRGVRVAAAQGSGQFVDKRRRAQIAARKALAQVVVGLRARDAGRSETAVALGEALHAAELQLPESWLPFVAAR